MSKVPFGGGALGTTTGTFSSGTTSLGTSGTLKKKHFFLLYFRLLKRR